MNKNQSLAAICAHLEKLPKGENEEPATLVLYPDGSGLVTNAYVFRMPGPTLSYLFKFKNFRELQSEFKKFKASISSVRDRIPADFPVRLIPVGTPGAMVCGTCGLAWDDSIATGYTPAPSGRCPFETFHRKPANL